MAGNSPNLTVVLSERAKVAIRDLWSWNAERYSVPWADRYVEFLRAEIEKIGTEYQSGRSVPSKPEYQYRVIKKRIRGHGHLAVYIIQEDRILILQVYHTAQDWLGRIERGEV